MSGGGEEGRGEVGTGSGGDREWWGQGRRGQGVVGTG